MPIDSATPDAQFVALLTEVQLPLQLYIRSLLPGDSSVGDVAQQANAKIWEKRADFELGTNFRAWAFRVARFEVLNYRKRQARDAKLTFSDDLEQTIAEEIAESKDEIQLRHAALRVCMTKLKASERELLLHRYADSGTLTDYAARVGRSAGGLKVTLHRVRNALLECIRRQLNDAGASP